MTEKHAKEMKKFFAPILSTIIFVGCGGPPSTVPNQNISTPSNEKIKAEIPAPTIKVYVENSGSMDGYVRGTTDFENAVYSYLSNIQLSDLGRKSDSTSFKNILELNYINSQVLRQAPDVQEFIRALEPNVFRMRGGNRGTSDMSDILNTILKQNFSKHDIAIFVSDCIFSPGNQYRANDNADEYLVSQQIGIKSHFVEQLSKNPEFSVVILQLTSQFNGTYYNKFDERESIDDIRPYYIWLMGDREQVKKIMGKVDIAQIKGSGVKNIFMVSKSIKSMPYGILPPPQSIGKFRPDSSNPKTSIVKAEVDRKGGTSRFQLAIGVDFSKMLIPEEYLTNAANYEVSNKAYNLEIVKNNTQGSSYTHIIRLNLVEPIISKGTVKITLKNSMPSWIEEYTDNEGLNIHANGAMKKTYGLKYLLGGVYDAYSSNKEEENNYGVITVNIR